MTHPEDAVTLPEDGRMSREDWIRDQEDKTARIDSAGTTDGAGHDDRPVVLLTTRGRKSGTPRKVPVMRVEHDGRYAVVASKAGAPTHPAWYHNITADPHVELQDGAVTRGFTAREVTGEERDLWWERAVAAYVEYSDYHGRADRMIPVFVLEPRT